MSTRPERLTRSVSSSSTTSTTSTGTQLDDHVIIERRERRKEKIKEETKKIEENVKQTEIELIKEVELKVEQKIGNTRSEVHLDPAELKDLKMRYNWRKYVKSKKNRSLLWGLLTCILIPSSLVLFVNKTNMALNTHLIKCRESIEKGVKVSSRDRDNAIQAFETFLNYKLSKDNKFVSSSVSKDSGNPPFPFDLLSITDFYDLTDNLVSLSNFDKKNITDFAVMSELVRSHVNSTKGIAVWLSKKQPNSTRAQKVETIMERMSESTAWPRDDMLTVEATVLYPHNTLPALLHDNDSLFNTKGSESYDPTRDRLGKIVQKSEIQMFCNNFIFGKFITDPDFFGVSIVDFVQSFWSLAFCDRRFFKICSIILYNLASKIGDIIYEHKLDIKLTGNGFLDKSILCTILLGVGFIFNKITKTLQGNDVFIVSEIMENGKPGIGIPFKQNVGYSDIVESIWACFLEFNEQIGKLYQFIFYYFFTMVGRIFTRISKSLKRTKGGKHKSTRQIHSAKRVKKNTKTRY